MRILFACESTAGQLAPIVAIYEALEKKNSEKKKPGKLEVMIMAKESDFLKAFVYETNIKFFNLGKGDNYKKTSILTSIFVFFKVMFEIFDYMPDVIVVKSGYVSLPVVIWGKIFGIPIIMHESDIAPDKMSIFISHFAKRIAVSFNKAKEFYNPKKVFYSGNPVSLFVAEADAEKSKEKLMIDSGKPTIFIMGGSKGTRKINNLVMEVLPTLLEDYEIIHQCGIGNYEEIRARVEEMNIPNLNDYHLFAFFKKSIADAYAAADLVISRAGSNTVAEIILVGKPSILIPLSVSEGINQTKNAYYYSEAGAALMLNEKNLKPNLFLNAINGLFSSRLKIMEMMRAARRLARPEAGETVAEEIMKFAK